MWHLTRLLTMTGLRSVSLWSVLLLLVGPAVGNDPKCLQVGDSIPEFQCLDDQGKMWDSREYAHALTELPEAQREVIVLYHLQGQKLADVAAEIDRSEAAVAGLLFRGLRTLHTL